MSVQNYQPIEEIKCTANFSDHSLTSTTGKPTWIDFIFFQAFKGF